MVEWVGLVSFNFQFLARLTTVFAEEGGESILFPHVGQVERGKAAALHPCVHIRAICDEPLDGQRMPLIHGLMQRNPAANIPRVGIGTVGKKQFDHLGVPPKRGRVQRSVTRLGLCVRIHTRIQVSPHSLDVSVEGGLVN